MNEPRYKISHDVAGTIYLELILRFNWVTVFLQAFPLTNKTGWFMMLKRHFQNISIILWRSVLLEEETRVPGTTDLPQVTDHHKYDWNINESGINYLIYRIHNYNKLTATDSGYSVKALWNHRI